MSMKLFPLALVTSLLIAAGVAVVLLVGASKGGGGDTSTLEGYFQAVNTVQTGIGTSFTSISAKYPQKFQDVQQTVAYLDESEAALADAVKKIKAIDPPASLQQQHAGFATAAEGVVAAFAGLKTGAQGAADAAALQTLLNTSDTKPFEDFTAACQVLQDTATQNDIPVQLNC